jgi:hypothetical protein
MVRGPSLETVIDFRGVATWEKVARLRWTVPDSRCLPSLTRPSMSTGLRCSSEKAEDVLK